MMVSTHSRAEAAAAVDGKKVTLDRVSTHSRAEAAAICFDMAFIKTQVSTHSRAEAAAPRTGEPQVMYHGFNTQPRGGGCKG